MTSISEIMGLSLLFVIPFVPIVLLVFAVYVWLCLSRNRKIALIFHGMRKYLPGVFESGLLTGKLPCLRRCVLVYDYLKAGQEIKHRHLWGVVSRRSL